MELRRLGLGVGVALVLFVAGGLLSTVSSRGAVARALPALPRVPSDLNADASALVIRPRAIIYTGDGTGILTGSSLRSRSGIRWSSWTQATAIGAGDNQIDNCTPSCAGGRYTGYPVTLEMWKPQILHGHHVFGRLTIAYTGTRPAGEPAHYTFTDIYDQGWGFGPPGAAGYCTDTDGQPPAAGCANIHTLP